MYLLFGRRVIPFAMALLLVGLVFTDANAQKRRTKKSRRVTNPVTTSSTSGATTTAEPQIISTAEESANDSSTTSRSTRGRRNNNAVPNVDPTQEKVDKLSAQVTALTDKLSQMEQQQRALVDLERLSRAESRAETLRAQLRDVQSQEAEMKARALRLDYELQPSVIERTLASTGSTRPEELREERRKQLETEKTNLQAQLNQLTTNRSRLETAVSTAELESDRLRARIDSALEPPNNEAIGTDVGAPPATSEQTRQVGEDRP